MNASAGVCRLAGLELEPGEHISIVNKGGEQHTFTRVKKYDGGFVVGLNALSGNPTLRTGAAGRIACAATGE